MTFRKLSEKSHEVRPNLPWVLLEFFQSLQVSILDLSMNFRKLSEQFHSVKPILPRVLVDFFKRPGYVTQDVLDRNWHFVSLRDVFGKFREISRSGTGNTTRFSTITQRTFWQNSAYCFNKHQLSSKNISNNIPPQILVYHVKKNIASNHLSFQRSFFLLK